MELSRMFQDFNHAKFVVHSSLLTFVFLFTLKLDGALPSWSWWVIFFPIWIWEALVFIGSVIGTIMWIKNPQSRVDMDSIVQFRAMWFSVIIHCFLILFELLACEQLAAPSHRWILVFLPLVFVSLLCFFVCVWCLKRDRPFELEMFCAVNIVQFVFLPLRLDEIITWSWIIVFIPLWTLSAVTLIGVCYSIIFACLIMKSHSIGPEQRWIALRHAMTSTIVVLPMLVSEVLLVYKLDGYAPGMSFFTCSVPLMATLLVLIFVACGNRGGNKWYFGMKKDFHHTLLALFPFLREYGNIRIAPESRRAQEEEEAALREVTPWETKLDPVTREKIAQCKLSSVPFTSIESPDP